MAQKRFNDLVVLVRNGVAVPALVVSSQLQADGREFLSVLYADPTSGPTLVLSGATRKVGSVQLGAPPLNAGAVYGWFDLPVNDAHAALLADHANVQEWNLNPSTPNMPVPAIDPKLVGNPGIHVPPAQRQALENDSDHDSRMKNLAFQHPPAILISTEAFEKEKAEAAGSGTERWPDGADNWTQTGDGTDYPGSYNVGPQLKAGDQVRVIESDGKINPNQQIADDSKAAQLAGKVNTATGQINK